MYLSELEEIIGNSFKSCGYDEKISITTSNRPELCDYQCNDIFKVAKKYNENPISVGEKIIDGINNLSDFKEYFKLVEFCKPGFINITLSDKFINKYIRLFYNDLKSSIKKLNKEKIMVDYGGPNVAKPLHVGHMRTTNIGEAIKRILEYFGHDVISDVHLGDFGLQVGQVIYKVMEDNLSIDNIDVKYLDVTYPYMSKLCKEDQELKEKCANITKELQDGNEQYTLIWKKICEVSVEDMKKSYKILGTTFDYWYGESDSVDYIEDTTNILKNIIIDSEGAKVIDIKKDTDKNDLPPLIYKKSNGAYLYGTTDLATIYQRKKDFDVNRIIYVADIRQSLHFEQVFRSSDKGNLFPYSNLEHIGYGTANGEDNKPYKTRGGDTPKLEKLINDAKNIFINKREENKNLSEDDLLKITNAILKFADLQTSYEKDYIFDLNKFSEVNGKTGPYILYTYLRLNKILSIESIIEDLSDNIYNEYDRNLRLKILEIGRTLNLAYVERRPNYICDYLYNLASTANLFYENNNISKEDNIDKKNDYLYIVKLTTLILKDLLNILAIKIPTKM